ncbi:MAG: PilZ domain-containing protein [Candidatus Acidiferrales bacterium]
MEGSSPRQFARTELDTPVDIQIGKQTIRIASPSNNVSVGGLFVRRDDLKVGMPVHITIPVNSHSFEADGRVDTVSRAGSGIEFKSLSAAELENLHELIADLTIRGQAAA